ncbi:MAG: hypothetical protein ACI4MP_01540 [Candidatus Ventricola sp.]
MEIALFASAWLAFSLSPALAPLALRCGLSACLRFSPRAAIALSSVAALGGCLGALAARRAWATVPPDQRMPVSIAGITGGTAGRMLLLMFVARFSGSLELARLQVLPLLAPTLAALLPGRLRRIPLPRTRIGLYLFSLFCALIGGQFGCGTLALFSLAARGGVHRKSDAPASAALLLAITAHASALLLTLLSGGAQVLPPRMLAALSSGAFVGGWRFEKIKKRGEVRRGLRTALGVYALLAALAGVEQAFFSL